MSLHPIPQRESPIQWYAIRTKPGRERQAIEGLRERRFREVYMPVERRLRRTAMGRKTVEHPLIPGYLFIGIGPESPDIYGALRIEAVSDLVRHASGVAATSADVGVFVYGLRAMEAAGEFDHTPKAKTWAIGTRAKITAGPWTGFIGEIVSAQEGQKARVMLSGLFGGKSGVPVDGKNLEAA